MQKDIEEKKKSYKSIKGAKLQSYILYSDPTNQIIEYYNNDSGNFDNIYNTKILFQWLPCLISCKRY